MANIFIQTPVYISIQDVRDTTTKTGLKVTATDDEIRILINKAQQRIDDYIVRYGTKAVDTQDWIFPTTDGLPEDITRATFYIVEQIFENGDTIHGSTTTTGTGQITSEKTGDRSVTYDYGTTTTSISNASALGFPEEALMLLKKYRSNFFKTKI